MKRIFEKLTVEIEARLRATGSFKSLLENYKYNSQEGCHEIKLFFDVIKISSHINYNRYQHILEILNKIISEVII